MNAEVKTALDRGDKVTTYLVVSAERNDEQQTVSIGDTIAHIQRHPKTITVSFDTRNSIAENERLREYLRLHGGYTIIMKKWYVVERPTTTRYDDLLKMW